MEDYVIPQELIKINSNRKYTKGIITNGNVKFKIKI